MCRVESYARAVVSGEIVAGRFVRLACERHLRDLETGHERGLKWSAKAADRAIRFFGLLKLPNGEPFNLEEFQAFIVGCVFGWKGPDGYRRFRTAYVEMGKGNGKSPLAGGIGLYGLVADGEAAAEIYSAATQREQAGIVFRDAKLMALASPVLKQKLHILDHNISFDSSFFRPVSSEHRGLDGKRPHIVLIDEVHEHPSSIVVDKMRAGTKGRKQALIFEITNSGYDRTSVCWNHHEYSAKVLDGAIENDAWFAYVCTLDLCERCRAAGKSQPTDGCLQCDQWTDEKVWPKANPGLGTILPYKYLREQVTEAQGMPSKINIVLRLCFCLWTEGESKAISMDHWRACSLVVDPVAWRKEMLASLVRRPCYGGLDLGSTSDLTALSLVFPPDGEDEWIVMPWFWVPSASARKRVQRDRIPYDVWIRQGFILETEGDVTDYDFVRRDMNDLSEAYPILELAVDRLFQGAQLCTQLMGDGFNVVPFGQGFFSMAAPTKRFLELVQEGKLQHGNNPVLTWMASNACTKQDPAGNEKFDKSKSSEKIDGIVAVTMGLGLAMGKQVEQTGRYYEEHELEVG